MKRSENEPIEPTAVHDSTDTSTTDRMRKLAGRTFASGGCDGAVTAVGAASVAGRAAGEDDERCAGENGTNGGGANHEHLLRS